MLKRILFFIAVAAVLLLIDVSPGWATEPLKPKWTREGLGYVGICKPGKLIIANNGPAGVLLDLTNGEILYQTKPDSNESSIYTNYYGDKFYVFPYSNNNCKEYDTKTKQYLRTIVNSAVPMSPTDDVAGYYSNSKSLKFYNAFTRDLLDSIYYPISFEISRQDREFTFDNKYFLMKLSDKNSNYSYFYLYDRTTREFLFKDKKDLTYCLFNNSNKIAYAENMKLAGDDTIYSYIRIYNPDQRKVIQDIKIAKAKINYFILRNDDNYIIYALHDGTSSDRIYDLSKNQIINNDLKLIGSPLRYADSSIIVTAATQYFAGTIYDWTTGIKDVTPKEDTVLYPNPADNKITVTIPEQYFSGIWQISDLTGKIIKKGIILPQNQLQIDISQLLPQTYFLTIKKDNLVKTYQIVKI
jgi:hypothetical protein